MDQINNASRQGLFFGLNSGVITTMGLICGLVQTKITVPLLIISIVSLAISDGISEAYSIYISKKAEIVNDNTIAPLYSFITLLISKVIIVVSFLIPLLFTTNLSYFKNMKWVFLWGLFLTVIFDYKLASMRNEHIMNYLVPHLFVIITVVGLTYLFGKLIDRYT